MSSVIAKFKCYSVDDFEHGKVAKLNAVLSDKGENKDFVESTPSGKLEITISKDYPASNFFKAGKDYYLDFTEVQ